MKLSSLLQKTTLAAFLASSALSPLHASAVPGEDAALTTQTPPSNPAAVRNAFHALPPEMIGKIASHAEDRKTFKKIQDLAWLIGHPSFVTKENKEQRTYTPINSVSFQHLANKEEALDFINEQSQLSDALKQKVTGVISGTLSYDQISLITALPFFEGTQHQAGQDFAIKMLLDMPEYLVKDIGYYCTLYSIGNLESLPLKEIAKRRNMIKTHADVLFNKAFYPDRRHDLIASLMHLSPEAIQTIAQHAPTLFGEYTPEYEKAIIINAFKEYSVEKINVFVRHIPTFFTENMNIETKEVMIPMLKDSSEENIHMIGLIASKFFTSDMQESIKLHIIHMLTKYSTEQLAAINQHAQTFSGIKLSFLYDGTNIFHVLTPSRFSAEDIQAIAQSIKPDMNDYEKLDIIKNFKR